MENYVAMVDHYLPSKIHTYFARLELEYTSAGEGLLLSIIRGARILVVPETTYDNWNGGTYGHDVIMFLPPEVIGRIRLGKQQDICRRLATDLNACAAGVTNENFNSVNLELNDENDAQFQQAKPFSKKAPVNPDTLSIWKLGYVRLFVSHRDNFKRQARRLASELEAYGVSCFVAHDTIEPMEVWQHEIEKGLATMEIMLALMTDDFHDSVWTNQEIGIALGKEIPVITVKLGTKDPLGFIAERQALKANHEHPESAADDIYKIIAEKLGQRTRLQSALIAAFAATPDWGEAKTRFQRLERLVKKLSEKELRQVLTAFEANDQLHNAAHLNNNERFLKFLSRVTGKEFEMKGNVVAERKAANMEDEIPF